MKIKIAVVTTHKHTQPGGVATYNRNIYKILTDAKITEFPTIDLYDGKENKDLKNKDIIIDDLLYGKNKKMILKSNYSKIKLNYIYQNFDLVIISHLDPPKKFISHPKSIFIQHANIEYYSFKNRTKTRGLLFSLGHLFSSILFGNGFIGQPFNHASNVVFFSKETSVRIENSFFIALSNDVLRENYKKRKGVMWAARMVSLKNPKILSMFINNGVKVNVYANQNKLAKKYMIQTKGYVNRNVLLKQMSKQRVFLVTSKTEGFIFTVVEALSSGMTVILFDTFDAAKYFDKCESVFLFKPWDVEEATKKINEINTLSVKEFNNLSKKSYDFARENFSMKTFKEKWENVIETVYKQSKK